MSKMMKYRPDMNIHQRRTACFNMTWDLFHIDHFFKTWVKGEKRCQTIFFTNDRVFQSVLRLAIAVQYQGGLNPVEEYIEKESVTKLRTLIDNQHERADRVYGTDTWSMTYRKCQIEKFEKQLFS